MVTDNQKDQVQSAIKDRLANLLEKKQKEQDLLEIGKEYEQRWKALAEETFSSPAGKEFLKGLIVMTKVFSVDNNANAIKLIENNTLRSVYLKLIRPYLSKKIIKEVE